jgi:hypothetical protein
MKKYVFCFVLVITLFLSHTKMHTMLVRDTRGQDYEVPVMALYFPDHELMELGIGGDYGIPDIGDSVTIAKTMTRYPGPYLIKNFLNSPSDIVKKVFVVAYVR